MADRPNENLSKKVITQRDEYFKQDSYSLGDIDTRVNSADALIQDIQRAYNDKNGSRLVTSGHQWGSKVAQLKEAHIKLNRYYEDLTNEEITVNRIETKAAWRNLVFRVGTTAAVALTIGTAYSIAGYFDNVYLPLQQKTVTYYYEGKHHATPPVDPSKYEEPQKVVSVTGSTKGNPLSISSSKSFAVAGEPKL